MPKDRKCCVRECNSSNRSSDFKIFGMPLHPGIRKKWVENLQLPPIIAMKKLLYVCSAHFEVGQYGRKVHKGAVPTLNLAVGCQACFKAQVLPTTNVLVIGASPTAISTALCARAIGADNICIASTMRDPLDMIQKTFDFNCMHYEQDAQYSMILERLYSVLHTWPDAVINCAISDKTMNLAVMALKPCGICVLAECDAECACFNAMDILMKNLKLLPSFRSINMFPTALNLIAGGKAPIGRLIANVFEWHEVEQAFRKALCESNIGYKKVIVKCMGKEDEF